MYDSVSVGRSGGGADYMYSIIHLMRALSENEAYLLIHMDLNSIPDSHPFEWNYNGVRLNASGNKKKLGGRNAWSNGIRVRLSAVARKLGGRAREMKAFTDSSGCAD